jgi:hypothetical protein
MMTGRALLGWKQLVPASKTQLAHTVCRSSFMLGVLLSVQFPRLPLQLPRQLWLQLLRHGAPRSWRQAS